MFEMTATLDECDYDEDELDKAGDGVKKIRPFLRSNKHPWTVCLCGLSEIHLTFTEQPQNV